MSDFFPPELTLSWRANDLQILATGTLLDVEEIAPHGVVRSIKFPLCDGAGAVCGIGSITIYIAGQRRAEEQLRDSEARTKAMIDASTDSLMLVDLEGRSWWSTRRPRSRSGERHVSAYVASGAG